MNYCDDNVSHLYITTFLTQAFFDVHLIGKTLIPIIVVKKNQYKCSFFATR
jgi:hypothetical protein